MTLTDHALLRRTSFATSDADEVTAYIRRAYVDNTTRFGTVRGAAGFTGQLVDAGSIATDRVCSCIDYAGTAVGSEMFCSFVLDRGAARIAVGASEELLTAGDVVACPIAVPHTFEMVDTATRVVRLPWAELGAAAELLGVPARLLRLEGMRPVSAPLARHWRHLAGLVHGSLSEEDSPAQSPLLRAELTRMTALAALHVFPNTTMSQHHQPPPGRTAPAALRRAIAHIEAHADQPLSLTDIAEAAGVGVRALQYSFRRHCDTTPLAHLRRVRLDRAHRDLQAADPQRGDTVAAIAARWGFGSPARFAAEHREAFGEPPSQTLRT